MTTRVTTATAWTPRSHDDYEALPGKPVFAADGERLGEIAGVLHPNGEAPGAHGPHWVALAGLGGGELCLHETAIREVRGDGVALLLTREQVEAQGWTDLPTGFGRGSRP